MLKPFYRRNDLSLSALRVIHIIWQLFAEEDANSFPSILLPINPLAPVIRIFKSSLFEFVIQKKCTGEVIISTL
jgi:hypothetical protein